MCAWRARMQAWHMEIRLCLCGNLFLRVCIVHVFSIVGNMWWVAAGLISLLVHIFCFFSLNPSYFKLGSVLMPPGSVYLQLPCLSLMSLQTKTCSRTQFDREKKKNAFLLPLGLQTLSTLDAKTSGPACPLWFVEIATVAHVWPQRTASKIKQWTAQKLNTYEINSHACRHSSHYQRVCIWSIQQKQTETMGVMWVSGTGSTTLCNWFSKTESSEVAAHMELNCGVRPYRHSHNPLPILQQAPWQTGGTEADNPLSKQVRIAVIAHCSPSMALIGFAHRSASEPSPEHLLLSSEGCTPTQQ